MKSNLTRRAPRRTGVFATLVVAMAVLAAGCAADGDDTEASASEPGETEESETEETDADDLPVVRILALQNAMGEVFTRVMEEEGFDVANGFKGDFFSMDGAGANQAFLQGEADVSINGDAYTITRARAQGQDPVLFMAVNNFHAAMVVRGDSDYEDPTDLVGAELGHYGDDTSATNTYRMFLGNEFGIDIFDDYSLTVAGPGALPELLAEGQVESIIIFSPHRDRAIVGTEGRDLYCACDAARDGAFVPSQVDAASTETWLTGNPETARAVEAAIRDTIAFIVDSDYEALLEEPYRSMLGVEDPDVLDSYLERVRELPLFADPDLWDDDYVEAGEQFLQAVYEAGIFESPPPGGTYVTLDSLLGE